MPNTEAKNVVVVRGSGQRHKRKSRNENGLKIFIAQFRNISNNDKCSPQFQLIKPRVLQVVKENSARRGPRKLQKNKNSRGV